MMKYLYLLLVLFVFQLQTATAQRIHLTDTSNRWGVRFIFYGDGTPSDFLVEFYGSRLIGDTVVNGLTYKKMCGEGIPHQLSNLFAMGSLYREDTVQKKVWCINYSFNGDDSEHLIYNGNWHVGDSISFNVQGTQRFCSIISIDSTQMDSMWYKVFHFIPVNYGVESFDIIEGIGSTAGPGFPAAPNSFESVWSISCFIHNNMHPKLSPSIINYAVGDFDNDASCTLATNNIIKNGPKLIIAPNPAIDEVNITIPSSMTGTLNIVDVTGRVMYNYVLKTTDAKLTIPVSSYAPGMYFVTYRTETGVKQSYKLIIK